MFQNRLFIKCFTFLEKVTVQSNLSHATMWFDINKNIIKFGSETIWCSCLCSQSGCLQVLEQNKNSLKQNKYDKYSYLVLPIILYSHFRNNCVAIKYSWKFFTALKNRVFCTCLISIKHIFAIKTIIRPSNIKPALVSLALILITINQNFIPFNFMATATKGEY